MGFVEDLLQREIHCVTTSAASVAIVTWRDLRRCEVQLSSPRLQPSAMMGLSALSAPAVRSCGLLPPPA